MHFENPTFFLEGAIEGQKGPRPPHPHQGDAQVSPNGRVRWSRLLGGSGALHKLARG